METVPQPWPKALTPGLQVGRPGPSRPPHLQVLLIQPTPLTLGCLLCSYSAGSGDSRMSPSLFLPQRNHTEDGVGPRYGRKYL